MEIVERNKKIELHFKYKIHHTTSKYTNKAGVTSISTTYLTVFPYELASYFNCEYVYFYVNDDKIYISREEPASIVKYQKRKLGNSNGNSKRVTLPTKLCSISSEYNFLEFVVYCNDFDFVDGSQLLVELVLP